MRSSFLEQASKLLKDHHKKSRWLSVVLCLALVAAGCTFYAFMRPGRAMVRTENVLQCPLLTHVHTENCGGGLTCGMAEYVFHTHGDYCFDAAGNLACTLPEIPAHIHDETCWQTEWTQACGLEEGPGHVHTPECYAAAAQPEPVSEPEPAMEPMALNERELLCVLLEHTHTEACYSAAAGAPVLACGQEENPGHRHDDACYTPDMAGGPLCGQEENHFHSAELGCFQMERTLICGWEEGMEHVHSDACYLENPILVCGRQEGHVHAPGCFNQILSCGQEESAGHYHTDACYLQEAGEAVLTCGLEEHVHTEACYAAAPAEPDGGAQPEQPETPAGPQEGQPICGLEEQEAHVHTQECWEERSTLVCGLPGVHMHNTSCYDELGERICGQLQIEEHIHGPACLIQVPVEDGVAGVYVCGMEEHQHTAFCGLPGMTWCGLEEHLHTEACLSGGPEVPVDPENPENPENPMDPENPEGPEVPGEVTEPELPEGKSWMCGRVSHRHDPQICYNGEGVLVCERQEHTHTVECLPPKDPEPVPLDEAYSYATEDGLFDINFHVAGVALLPVEEEPAPELNAAPAVPEAAPAAMGMDAAIGPAYDGGMTEGMDFGPDMGVFPENGGQMGAAEIPAQPETPAEPELAFTVTALDGNNHDYFLFFQQAEEREEQLLSALTVSITYGGRELDLSGCTITAEIVPTEKLLSTMLENAGGEEGEASGLRLTAYEKDGVMGVEVLDSLYIEGQSAPAGHAAYPAAYKAETDWSEEDGARSLTQMAYAAPPQYEEPTDGWVDPAATGEPGMDPMDLRMTVTVKGSKEGADLAVAAAQTEYEKFTVQYYAEVRNADITQGRPSSGAYLELINTSQKLGGLGRRPTNQLTKDNAPVVSIRFDDKNPNGTPKVGFNGEIKMSDKLVKIYKESVDLSYENYKYLKDITTLPEIDHYDRVAIWVLKEGGDPTSDDPANWNIREVDAPFTNNAAYKDDENYVVIQNGTVLRLVYAPSEGTYGNSSIFYDYDISDGKVYNENGQEITERPNLATIMKEDPEKKYYMKNFQEGINSAANYKNNSGLKFAFGNENFGVSLDLVGNIDAPNKGKGNIYGGCSFEVVGDTLDAALNLQYNFSAPKLFNEKIDEGETVLGKSDPIPADLIFNRVGDTYTLTAVSGQQARASNLDKMSLTFEGWASSGPKPLKYSNLFWPLDASTDTWGTEGHDMIFGATGVADKFHTLHYSKTTLPTVDEGGNNSRPTGTNNAALKTDVFHNAYFGMTFAVDFRVPENYVGPLEYLFFGDDDMWVYLVERDKDGKNLNNGKLICDIGGVHSAAGEYVDLWDYIHFDESATTTPPAATAGQGGENGGAQEVPDNSKYYTLYFFFTERGASGSTCWMQFTVPDASSRVLTPPTKPAAHTMKVEKRVEGGQVDPNMEFEFEIKFEGEKAADRFYYTRYHADGTLYGDDENGYEGHPDKTLSNEEGNNRFKLKCGEYIRVQGMVNGTTYTITELMSEKDKDIYHLETDSPDVSVDGSTASGTVKPGSTGDIDVTLVNKIQPRLPETAGSGTVHYAFIGGLLALGASGGLLWRKRRGRRL